MTTASRTFGASCAPAPRRTGLFALAALAFDTWRQRQVLAKLDDDRLADLGLSYRQARTEAHRPIWDVPAIWRR